MSTGEESYCDWSSSNGSHDGRSPGGWSSGEGSSCEGTLDDWTLSAWSPFEDSSVERSLAEGSPVEGRPVEESPICKSPIEESPVGESPVGESPVGESPVGESPVGESPVGESPVGESPVGGCPVGGCSVGGCPVGGSPVGESSAGGSSVEGSLCEGSTSEWSVVEGSLGNAPISHFHFSFFGIRMALKDDGIFRRNNISLQLYLLLGPCFGEGPLQCDVDLSPLQSEDGSFTVVSLFPLNESSDYLWNNLDGEFIVNLRDTSVRAIFWRSLEDGARLEALNYVHSFFEDELKIPLSNIERDSPLVLKSLGLPIDSVSTSPSCITLILLKATEETTRSLSASNGDSFAMVYPTFSSSNGRQLRNGSTPSRRSTFDADSFLPLRILHEILNVDYVDLECMEHNLLMRLIVGLISLKRPLELSLIEHSEILWIYFTDTLPSPVSVEEISKVREVARKEENLLIELNNLIYKLLEEFHSRDDLDLYSTGPNIQQTHSRRGLRLDLRRALESIHGSPCLLSLRRIFFNCFRNS